MLEVGIDTKNLSASALLSKKCKYLQAYEFLKDLFFLYKKDYK
jgi:hypothetical protein